MKRRLTTPDFIKRAMVVHGTTYDYRSVEYVKTDLKVKIGCSKHGIFEQTPENHLQGQGCRGCDEDRRHQSRVDWSEVERKFKKLGIGVKAETFTTMHANMTMTCTVHGEFQRAPIVMLKAKGCPKCMKNSRLTVDQFYEECRAKHAGIYTYKGDYSRLNKSITVICPSHGDFTQLAQTHRNGGGCPKCSYDIRGDQRKDDTSVFIEKARSVHGDRYNYDNAHYRGSLRRVSIGCKIHGEFEQISANHLQGHNCPGCGRTASSGEMEIAEWLRGFNIKVEIRNRTVLSRAEIDIYLPDHKLGIEYTGLYWHSDRRNPDPNHLLKKHRRCEEAGIRLVTLFEDEWLYHPDKVKASLGHFLGLSTKGIFARKARIAPITTNEALPFLKQYHLLGAGSAHQYMVGAYDQECLIAVMTFRTPNRERAGSKQIEMTRFVTDGRNHPGLGSRMFQWAVREYKFERVVAFVDRRWFTGSFKTVSGFNIVTETKPTLWWVKASKRYQRRFKTKRSLARTNPDSKGTKLEIMRELGYSRIWDCGKLKLEWNSH